MIVLVVTMSHRFEFGWNRIGLIITVIFDIADVPLHMAKACKVCMTLEDVYYYNH